MDLSREKNYKLHSFFHSFSFRFIPEETFQVSITQIDRSIRSSGKRSALVMLLTYSVNGAELGIYFRVRSVLVKLQPAFQSLHQVEDSSNQSPASKQSWNSFVPTEVPSAPLPICGARGEFAQTELFIDISFQHSFKLFLLTFRICPSISLSLFKRIFARFDSGSKTEKEREKDRKRERGAKKYRSGKLVLGGASQACAQFHGKILIEDNRS